jgi:S1-C subfamily serine protease
MGFANRQGARERALPYPKAHQDGMPSWRHQAGENPLFKPLLILSRGRAYPAGPTLMCLCLLMLTAMLGLSTPVNATPDVQDAMVKIYLVANRPDYDNPWNRKGPESASGSGGIIAGERILTNAHVVSDHTFLQVQRHGQAKKYTTRVAPAGPLC